MIDMTLAQVAPAIPDIYGELARTGLLGMLLVGAFFVIKKLYTDVTIERAARVTDAKEALASVKLSTEAMTKWTETQQQQNRAMEEMAEALKRLVTK